MLISDPATQCVVRRTISTLEQLLQTLGEMRTMHGLAHDDLAVRAIDERAARIERICRELREDAGGGRLILAPGLMRAGSLLSRVRKPTPASSDCPEACLGMLRKVFIDRELSSGARSAPNCV